MPWDASIDKVIKDTNSRALAKRHIHIHLTSVECLCVAHGLFNSEFYYKSLQNRVT